MSQTAIPVPLELGGLLTAAAIEHVAVVPAELECFVKLEKNATKRAYDDGLVIQCIGHGCRRSA